LTLWTLPTNFVYLGTHLQQKKIQELKQKILEHAETKRSFKPFYFQASAPIVVVVKQVDA
jgi:hypothetical protein